MPTHEDFKAKREKRGRTVFALALLIQSASYLKFGSPNAIASLSVNAVFKFAASSKAHTRLTWTAHELPRELMNARRGNGELLSIVMPKAIELSLSDVRGRRVAIPTDSAKETIVSFLQKAHSPCVLSAFGYPDIVLKRKRALNPLQFAASQPVSFAPRSRREARLLNAFGRGRVSPYSICTIRS